MNYKKYSYLGYIPYDYLELEDLLKYLDNLVRPWWCPNWLANTIDSTTKSKLKWIPEGIRGYVKQGLYHFRSNVFKGINIYEMKWKYGVFVIDMFLRNDYNPENSLSEQHINEIYDRIAKTEKIIRNNHKAEG